MSSTDKPAGSTDEPSDGAKKVIDEILTEEKIKSQEKAPGSPDASDGTEKPTSDKPVL